MARDKKKLTPKSVTERYISYRVEYGVKESIELTAEDFGMTIDEVSHILGW